MCQRKDKQCKKAIQCPTKDKQEKTIGIRSKQPLKIPQNSYSTANNITDREAQEANNRRGIYEGDSNKIQTKQTKHKQELTRAEGSKAQGRPP